MASPCLPATAELMKEFYYFIAQINACFTLQIRKEPSSSSSSSARQPMVGPGLLKNLCPFVSVEGDPLPFLDF